MKRDKRIIFLIGVQVCIAALFCGGCKNPHSANILLRKENQVLRDEIESHQRRAAADAATIDALQTTQGTAPQLPREKLQRLYTTAGLQLGRLTGVRDNTIRIQAVPIDQDGQPLKAAGAFHVELYDVSSAQERKIGEWDLDLDAARTAWLGEAFQYAYLLEVRLQSAPTSGALELRVTFKDELTGRAFTESKSLGAAI